MGITGAKSPMKIKKRVVGRDGDLQEDESDSYKKLESDVQEYKRMENDYKHRENQ